MFALPKENRYDVEVIDVWEVHALKVLEQVNGEVQFRFREKGNRSSCP